jgi:Kef-type K+ transport system membrane component KefB
MEPRLFLSIALILLSTKAFSLLMKRIHLPAVIGALLAGVLLGPAAFGFMELNEAIMVLSEIGVVLLLFSAGMETDFRQLRSVLKSSLLISVLGVAMALGGGFAVAFAFGQPTFESFCIGVVIASMSTSITVEALHEIGKLKTKPGTAILGASLFDDIFVIVILAVLMGTGADTGGLSIASVGILLLKIVVFFAFAIAAGYGINKLFNSMVGRFGNRGRFSIFAIAYCFLMAYLAEWFGLAGITGAYIAGIAFCSTRCTESLEANTHTLSYMLFTPIFLAGIGLQTSFSGMTVSLALFSAALVVVAIASKVIGCGLGAKLCRFTNRESLQVGVGMVARGEVSFVVISKCILMGFVGAQFFPSVIVIVLVTVLITPIWLKSVFAQKNGGP